ncbi:MAG: 7TM diverse intracellular signaling domain-containing protein, partial [Smithella sp.]|nr:7TM diverse intracellular signaling domain-containing protein [Smithella sp.]
MRQKIILILFFSPIAILINNTPLFSKIVIDKSLTNIAIGQELEYLEDKNGQLSLENAVSAGYQKNWRKSTADTLGFGFTNSVYWLRFTVKNKSGDEIKFLLSQSYPLIDHLKLFVPEAAGSFTSIEIGDHKNFSERPCKNKNLIFPIHLKGNAEATYYLRQESTSSMNFILSIWSIDAFNEDTITEYQLLLFYYGIITVMIVYNLALFFFIRRSEYIYYAFFILFFLLFIMTQNGTAFQLLWPNNPWWANYFIPISLCMLLIFAVLFTNAFLNLKNNNPLYYKISIYIQLPATYIVTLLCFFLPYRYAISTSALATIVIVCYDIFLGVLLSFKKNRSAYFYTTTWLFFLVGSFLYILMTFGVLPANFITVWSIQIGSVFQVVLLSIALADRVNTMRKDLTTLTTHLEDKVDDRTKELHGAMEELESMNEQLTNTRDALWGEMQLAKKIQTVLLPREPSMRGYEIAARMMTADEVGGDYYDVINAEGRDWIVIGDVSGHGVSAGIIMMMAQTSIHTALRLYPALSASELISAINAVIYENIKMMHEQKFMTMTVIACHDGETFHFSGAHQDIMIYRAASREVEIVETRGIWIGVLADIRSRSPEYTFTLGAGDVVLLYTDGITEAFDMEGKQFSQERL